jgi:hypothetical protein
MGVTANETGHTLDLHTLRALRAATQPRRLEP